MNSLDADEALLFADANTKEWLVDFLEEWHAPQMKMLAQMVISSLGPQQIEQLKKMIPETYDQFVQSFGIQEGEPWQSITGNQPAPQPPPGRQLQYQGPQSTSLQAISQPGQSLTGQPAARSPLIRG